MQKMTEIITRDEEAILVELAEECTELAQMAIKLARIRCVRSPADEDVTREHMIEEMGDVYLMLGAARQLLTPTEAQRMRASMRYKQKRMIERLGKAE